MFIFPQMIKPKALNPRLPPQILEFLNHFSRLSLRDLNEKGIAKIKNAIHDISFDEISPRALETYINLSRNTIYRMKKEELTAHQKPGPKDIISEDAWIQLLELSMQYREKLLAVSIQWAEKQFETRLAQFVRKQPSRWTMEC